MKKFSFLLSMLCITCLCFSQTKLIAHRSHSGKNQTFSKYAAGNFGLPTHKEKKDTSVRKRRVPQPLPDSTITKAIVPSKKVSAPKRKYEGRNASHLARR